MLKYFLSASILATCAVGFVLGLGGATFVQGQGLSYFSDNPRSCINCHIMYDQYDSWMSSTHREFTNCNSCHAPKNPILALAYKAENGFNHALKFTTGVHSDPINIRPHNLRVSLNACLDCHGDQMPYQHPQINQQTSCLHCHHNVGHPLSRLR